MPRRDTARGLPVPKGYILVLNGQRAIRGSLRWSEPFMEWWPIQRTGFKVDRHDGIVIRPVPKSGSRSRGKGE
jgi:hypothetical protein